MATSWNYVDTSTPKNISVPDVNFSEFAHDSIRSKSSEPWITNSTSPIDRPETLRTVLSNRKNIYDGTGILPAYFAVNKTGKTLVVQLHDIYTVVDDNDPSKRADYPISVEHVIKFPTSADITASVILTCVKRSVAMLFGTGETNDSRLGAMIRGALEPSNLG